MIFAIEPISFLLLKPKRELFVLLRLLLQKIDKLLLAHAPHCTLEFQELDIAGSTELGQHINTYPGGGQRAPVTIEKHFAFASSEAITGSVPVRIRTELLPSAFVAQFVTGTAKFV